MRPFPGSWWCCALAALAVSGGSARAAWNNVFQVCCHNCRGSAYPPVAAVPAPAPAPAPCASPCQQCTTQYVQRCYYQPVVTYRQSCYVQPVTTYRTSYYYEPVTSYRYSCYYDPCSCSYQQVAQPVTSYRLRSQCCPVTSYLQRCCMQPVTSYQQMTYYEPVTTCCTTTVGAPIAALPPGAAAVPAGPPPGASAVPGGPPPGVSAGPGAPAVPAVPGPGANDQPGGPPAGGPPPGVSDSTGGPPTTSLYNRGLGYRPPSMPPASDPQSFRQPQLRAPVPAQPVAPVRPPQVRFDRITALPDHNTQGQVIRTDRLPQPGARVLFVSADRKGTRQAVTADGQGRFQTTLAAGNWLVYVQDASGKLVYQQKVDVWANRTVPPMVLVSR